MSASATADGESRPLLRVVAGGEPDAEELAALVAVVSALAGPSEADPGSRDDPRRPGWSREGWLAAARRGALRGGR